MSLHSQPNALESHRSLCRRTRHSWVIDNILLGRKLGSLSHLSRQINPRVHCHHGAALQPQLTWLRLPHPNTQRSFARALHTVGKTARMRRVHAQLLAHLLRFPVMLCSLQRLQGNSLEHSHLSCSMPCHRRQHRRCGSFHHHRHRCQLRTPQGDSHTRHGPLHQPNREHNTLRLNRAQPHLNLGHLL